MGLLPGRKRRGNVGISLVVMHIRSGGWERLQHLHRLHSRSHKLYNCIKELLTLPHEKK